MKIGWFYVCLWLGSKTSNNLMLITWLVCNVNRVLTFLFSPMKTHMYPCDGPNAFFAYIAEDIHRKRISKVINQKLHKTVFENKCFCLTPGCSSLWRSRNDALINFLLQSGHWNVSLMCKSMWAFKMELAEKVSSQYLQAYSSISPESR